MEFLPFLVDLLLSMKKAKLAVELLSLNYERKVVHSDFWDNNPRWKEFRSRTTRTHSDVGVCRTL